MKNIREYIKNNITYFDGGFGTVVQKMGLPKGCPPEIWNLTNPDKVTAVHKSYIEVGCNIVTTNTFGVNRDKYDNYREIISAAVNCARTAADIADNVFVAFDIGPTGRMLSPLGDLDFEEAVSIFAANVIEAENNGADLIIIETMNDAYETKAAVIAAKENSNLPIFVTNAYDKSGKLMTGADPKAMIAMLESLGVDAIGMNCSFGPDSMLEIIDEFRENCSVPIITSPNAGLPSVENGETVYNISAEEFAGYMKKLALKGVTVLGGCCGTTPEYIRKTVEATKEIPFKLPVFKNKTVISSYTHSVCVENTPVLIGERINPTGKSKLKEALRENNFSYILNEGIKQADCGVHILDVNVGLPEIDEAQMMYETVKRLQAVTDLPLQLDSADTAALQKAMRIYNGKPLINSVNGEKQVMDSVFPLIKKYGGAVIALTMDENGIPKTAKERLEIAKRIEEYAARYGIHKKDIIVDPLCLTISSNQNSALVTLEAIRLLNENGFKTSLGVSNISFGLPKRDKINAVFFGNALENGLNCAIMNPFSSAMMDTYYSFKALHGMDFACGEYIAYASSLPTTDTEPKKLKEFSLYDSIIKGVKENAVFAAKTLLDSEQPMEIINKYIIPALDDVGKSFETGKMFLPQLLMSAEAASSAFAVLKDKMVSVNTDDRRAVILATVKGDIHDIGKNIVKVLLESYGFKVYDLGKDVDALTICEAVEKTGCRLVGLSALMTTTVSSMEETIKLLNKKFKEVTVIVGGAVLNEDYAKMINADAYCADAMAAVRFAENYYSK